MFQFGRRRRKALAAIACNAGMVAICVVLGTGCRKTTSERKPESAIGRVRAANGNGGSGNFLYVCKDGGAGGYEAFPDICRTAEGELLCVFYAGFSHVSLPSYGPGGKLPPEAPKAGRICMVRSNDNGRTWSEPTVVVDTPLDDRDPSITELPDGTLICNYFAHRQRWLGQGFHFSHSALVRSTDGGKTWSSEQILFDRWACSSPIRRLQFWGGKLALPLYYVPAGNSRENGIGGVSFSTDKGHTWSDVVPIGNGTKLRLAAEPDIVELPDKTLLAGLRPDRGEDTMAFAWSKDGGRSWTDPIPAQFVAHNIYFLMHQDKETGDEILLMAHRIPGTALHYSFDYGRTWVGPIQLDPAGGACPSMTELPDGSIYIVFYREGPNSDICGMRFRAGAQGIEIIPPEKWDVGAE